MSSMTALTVLDRAFCTDREMARPAMLKIASSDDVSTPSVPAMSIIAMNTSTIRTMVRIKPWALLSILERLRTRFVSRMRILMNTTQQTSKMAAARILESA